MNLCLLSTNPQKRTFLEAMEAMEPEENLVDLHVSEYVEKVRAALIWKRNVSNQEHPLDKEIDDFIGWITKCAHNILELYSKTSHNVTIHDIRAACTLARKTFLGYDFDVVFDDRQYNKWIVNFLKSHEWVACKKEQQSSGELPLRFNAVV